MYVVKDGTSKQAWLATVQHCPSCGGQKPRDGFKRVHGVDICAECQLDNEQTYAEQINELAKWALAMNDETSLRDAMRRILLLSQAG